LKSWLLKASRYIGIGFILFGLFLLLLVETHHRLQDETMSTWEVETDADCALVLTGGPHRVREGFALLARKQVRHLIIAGVHPATELTDLITPWDLVWGPDLDRIVLEKRSTTTYGNAQQSLPIVEGLGCQKLELITSQLHMYRAFKTLSGSFPESIIINKHPVPPLVRNSSFVEYWTEVLKTMFYAVWAF
jgi:uncharacterized SAM-binding protein YcdF (DUF218 family)